MRHVLVLLLVAACSSPNHHKSRWPSSILLENKSYENSVTLYSGQGMPQEMIIAKSLPNAPLQVEILDASGKVHCLDSHDKKESSSFRLPSNKRGRYDSIACRLDHSGSEYPESYQFNVRYTVILDDFEISESEYKTKNELLSYIHILDQNLEWTDSMISFVEGQLSLKNRTLNPQLGVPETIFQVESNEPIFVSIQEFSHYFQVKKFIGSTKVDAKGLKRNEKTLYPYNEKAVVCGSGIEDGRIKKVILAEGELGQAIGSKENFNCHFNFKRGENKFDKNRGGINVFYKAASFGHIRKLIMSSISNENIQIQRRINSYHNEEYYKSLSNYNEFFSIMISWRQRMQKIIKTIDRNKFVAYKDKIINDLFPAVINGNSARSANNFTITPVKKIVYNESGQQKKILYLNIKNSISYKIETAEFSDELQRDLPFEEQVNLYLATSELFEDQKEKSFTVCNSQIEDFYNVLGKLQQEMNSSPAGHAGILNAFQKTSVGSAVDCKLGDMEKKEIAYNRGAGKTDYSIYWNKKVLGSKEELEAIQVSNTYSSNILGQAMTKEIFRDKKSSHPVFKKSFSLSINKGSKDSLWVEEKKAYVEKFDEESFIKIGY